MSYNCLKEGRIYTKNDVINAIKYAEVMHEGQFRRTGESYIVHPRRVAELVDFFLSTQFNDSCYDANLLNVVSNLHDTIEDTDATFKDLVDMFGTRVANIVDELTTEREKKKELGKARYLALKMRDMSGEALLIKLCDRLDNTSDLMQQSKEFRIRYFKETYTILCFVLQNRHLKRIHLEVIRCIIEQLCLLKFAKLDSMQPKQKELRRLVGLPKQAA